MNEHKDYHGSISLVRHYKGMEYDVLDFSDYLAYYHKMTYLNWLNCSEYVALGIFADYKQRCEEMKNGVV